MAQITETNMTNRRTLLKAGALLGAASGQCALRAQSNGKTVRLVIGFLPGGVTDVIARTLADGLNKLNPGAQVIVDSRPGASGRIAVLNAKNSPPDGTTLLLSPGNVLTLLPHFFKNDDLDPMVDLVPVAGVFAFAYVFSVGPAVPASVVTMKDYLAWAKAHPEKATFAGISAAPQHLLTAQLSRTSSTPLTLVPYKGGGPLMVQDVLRGDVPAVAQITGDALQWQGPDKLRTLASFTKARSPFLPDVPTIGEAGFPDLMVSDWGAVYAPRGTPPAIVKRWSEAIQQVVSQPSFKAATAMQGAEPYPTNAMQIAQTMREDTPFWGRLVASTGVTMQ
ncbi:Bug family tripartite tricarboxylate transporter substrate binding protein [Xylophilus sp. GOD-11R]|uniref:Bug family tripartite tricarboxylate transporter substrate binding protein n=1 Tax=Xylophilus sp. GOD-11R TaxID=3089814 RepID=UPI00298D2F90|nr:tripartite tricarboxylate transporter substrate-binding protein [Xylophilus sp. GOD-11R]WPB55925.1 tripartite tricarboxylate transporter substrate-binding protein [Xylophilus sp. GOD-11R]